jgi:hypothetical protein
VNDALDNLWYFAASQPASFMPLFYFDFDDNGTSAPDRDGLEIETLELARVEALRTLAEMARDQRPIVGKREMVCIVKDAAHEPIYRVALAMRCEPLRD